MGVFRTFMDLFHIFVMGPLHSLRTVLTILFGIYRTIFHTTTTTTCLGLFSANCTGLIASSTATAIFTGKRNTAASQQTYHPNPSKNLLEFLSVHGPISFVRYAFFPMKKAR